MRKVYMTSPSPMQCNTMQLHNKKISEKYLGGISATQHNTTVLEGNFNRNKPKCNTVQCNTTQHNSAMRRFQRNTLEKQVQHNATQQWYMELLLEINASVMQHNRTVQQEDIKEIPQRNRCNAMQHKFY